MLGKTKKLESYSQLIRLLAPSLLFRKNDTYIYVYIDIYRYMYVEKWESPICDNWKKPYIQTRSYGNKNTR